jgi:hypothetical protein
MPDPPARAHLLTTDRRDSHDRLVALRDGDHSKPAGVEERWLSARIGRSFHAGPASAFSG